MQEDLSCQLPVSYLAHSPSGKSPPALVTDRKAIVGANTVLELIDRGLHERDEGLC